MFPLGAWPYGFWVSGYWANMALEAMPPVLVVAIHGRSSTSIKGSLVDDLKGKILVELGVKL